MIHSDLIKFYQLYGWFCFYGRVAPRLTDWCWTQLSYTQMSEDYTIDFLFEGGKIFRPTHLEPGTNHRPTGNNTYKFHRKVGERCSP